ncbi:CENP-Q, a CENPA-CAD centromere complex subunit-domain-containing protein [Daldinia caldariorum]|uniref:CENP-Q, a CENPA-CAD centromere complex subunit-domain-containing protein n=1 Tax=Daldinia caldariorum TaxID=326644 RepID=UPI0020086B8E|nr:CENP-Q, a CENPA-CAD centromere complex subunit-domain-containing protein [Daldinia caldariorum]KAI1471076.1 CENP-Q, a CENPA-CAD centromere complex subunit-domain-containing protein [Daldinia caldariorum]
MEESSRPRKRGRPANIEISSQSQPEPKPSQTQKAKRKRGPSPIPQDGNDRDEEERDQEIETVPTERRKRGHPQASTNAKPNVQEENTSNVADENAPRNKRGRPTKGVEGNKSNEVEEDEADDENEGDSSLVRRSGRIRRSPNSSNKGARETAKPTNKQKSDDQPSHKLQKKGRPPINKQGAANVEQDAAPPLKKRRGRPSLINQPPANADTETDPGPQSRLKKRSRPPPAASSNEEASSSTKGKGKKSQDAPAQNQDEPVEEENRPRKHKTQSNKTSPKSRRRKQSPDAQDRSSSPDSATSPPRYRHLATRTRRVPLNIIESKWTALEQPALASVASLLQSASRPVLLRLSTNPQRHTQASAALNAVSKRLCSKIARGLPFPPATTSTRREEEFEFERTVSGIQALESQLDPLLHSVELLRREKERAEKELESEYKALARLGSNAQAEARERRDQIRKMHVLVPEKKPLRPESGVDSLVGETVPIEKSAGKVFAGLDEEEEEELAGLAGQIASHMESMRGNLQQIDGVVPAITKSRGLLRAALQSRLDREQLDNIILG